MCLPIEDCIGSVLITYISRRDSSSNLLENVRVPVVTYVRTGHLEVLPTKGIKYLIRVPNLPLRFKTFVKKIETFIRHYTVH